MCARCSRVAGQSELQHQRYSVHRPSLGPIPICGDNQGSIFIASNPVTEHHSKHIDIQYHYICEVIARGLVQVTYIPGKDNKITLWICLSVIYWDKSHFTCTMIGKQGNVYYYNGILFQSACIHEGKVGVIMDVYNVHEVELTYIILSLV